MNSVMLTVLGCIRFLKLCCLMAKNFQNRFYTYNMTSRRTRFFKEHDYKRSHNCFINFYSSYIFLKTHTYIHLGQIHLPLMDRPSIKGVIKKNLFLFFIGIQMKNKKVFLMTPLTDGPSIKVR